MKGQPLIDVIEPIVIGDLQFERLPSASFCWALSRVRGVSDEEERESKNL
jgi:hypothetical protein